MAIRGPGIARSVGNAERIRTDTDNFDNNLSALDDNVQKALDTLDDLIGGGSGGTMVSVSENPNKIPTTGNYGDHAHYSKGGEDLIYVCISDPSGTIWVVT